MKKIILTLFCLNFIYSNAQQKLSIEKLWNLGRVAYQGMSHDKNNLYYSVSIPNIEENKNNTQFYSIPINGGVATELKNIPNGLN
ncbi:MAG: S9 family peptidase, partial [Chitinophagaceae bacterium]|nr:S9 family peptidase [Chitinophagaceae bacterium]